jgi:fructuronate reductase
LIELGIHAWPQLQTMPDVALPDYVHQMPWLQASTGVVHIGLGAFHRAHQAVVFDHLLKAGDSRWAITGVAMANAKLVRALDQQQGLYGVRMARSNQSQWQICGAIRNAVLANEQKGLVISAIAQPETRWITLTVTEKGYAQPLAALLVDGLQARHAAGLSGLTLASCDNLPSNGHVMQRLCLNEAMQRSESLANWIRNECCFPCSMVDRIVPAATPALSLAAQEALGVQDTAAVGTEVFWEWVIEDRFVDAGDAKALRSVGVQVVPDVAVFEEAKLRMLNGSHSAMAYIGAVAGWPVISDCIGQRAVHRYVHDLMTEEMSPHVRRPDWLAYRDALLARFANPTLQHSVHQIASDGSQKIPLRWQPCALGQLAQGQPMHRLAFAAAAWMRYCQGVDEAGASYAISDPLAQAMRSAATQHMGNAALTAQAMLNMPSIWGQQLPMNSLWQRAVADALHSIFELGILRALTQLNDAALS